MSHQPADAAAIAALLAKVEQAAEADFERNAAAFPLAAAVPFLVTGANGSLGRAIVARLKDRVAGARIRVLVRRVPADPDPALEYVIGDLGAARVVDRAVQGAEVVIHAGAAMHGGWPEHVVGTVLGTQHVLDACARHAVRQLVYVSSLSVIDWAGSVGRGKVDESAALEPHADKRGAYTRAKLAAEGRVSATAAAGLPAVILRPGQIFGGGIPLVNGAVARRVGGAWIVLGDGTLELPLVYLDDVVDAIVAAVDRRLVGGEVIQLVDPDALTQAEVLDLVGHGAPRLEIPRPIVLALGKLGEIALGVLRRPSPLGGYRLQSALARLTYGSDRARTLLDWTPKVGVREGIRRVGWT